MGRLRGDDVNKKKRDKLMSEYVSSIIESAEPYVDKGLSSSDILMGFHLAAHGFAEALIEIAKEEVKKARKKR